MKLERRCGQSLRTDRESWQPNSNTRKEHWVGENLDPEEIDEHCGVADPGCRYAAIIPRQRLGFREGGNDGAPTFDCPFPPKMSKPTPHARAAQSWLFGCVHSLTHAPTLSLSSGTPSIMSTSRSMIKNKSTERTKDDVGPS